MYEDNDGAKDLLTGHHHDDDEITSHYQLTTSSLGSQINHFFDYVKFEKCVKLSVSKKKN